MANRPVTTALYDRLQTQAHVWFCQPAAISDTQKLAAYKTILSASEFERYRRFHFEKDRHNYLVSHALLRHALSKYAALPASHWQFVCGEHGRPELASSLALPGLFFNLTHTDGFSACVISSNRRCGIDAENIHRKNKLDAVARRMFAEEELAQLDEKNIGTPFYFFWTLREAYVKALGTGLAGSSKDFYFDVDRNGLNVKMHSKRGSFGDNNNWQFALSEPTSTHVLAVTVESSEPVSIVMDELVP